MDHYAADVAAVVEHLDLRDAAHVGHSTGGDEATRQLGRSLTEQQIYRIDHNLGKESVQNRAPPGIDEALGHQDADRTRASG